MKNKATDMEKETKTKRKLLFPILTLACYLMVCGSQQYSIYTLKQRNNMQADWIIKQRKSQDVSDSLNHVLLTVHKRLEDSITPWVVRAYGNGWNMGANACIDLYNENMFSKPNLLKHRERDMNIIYKQLNFSK